MTTPNLLLRAADARSGLRDRARSAVRRRDAGRPASNALRCASEDLLRVDLTVNGRAATVHVAPRVTLADALRDHLGLTGTHIGCEHGVCGVCTVLIDGDAARSCLTLACQVDGSDIVTVEGMGTATDLHPLQESFGRHHGLQCGFCTPGQIMSAYDLLSSEPDVDDEQLPEQLSGVLCRCTGYRNIVDAVADVAHTYRDGVPAPHSCPQSSVQLSRATLGGPGTAVAFDDGTASGPTEIRVPSGEPTATVAIDTVADAPLDDVWAVLQDTTTLAACLAGAEIVADFGDDRYKARMGIHLGPVRLALLGDLAITERDEASHHLTVVGQGADASSGDVAGRVDLTVAAHGPDATTVHAVADLHMVGRIAQFGRGLVNDVSRDIFQDFTDHLAAAARGEAVTHTGPSALAMAVALLKTRIRRTLRSDRAGK
ncbi:2Fe-2S iron-sulfur cluster-binding protein [Flexivirga sp.]|uniref:2Fe-2S iron-sulfur cluster-binding protein n=1 Tax=Flexivirga sp. TaxID=1962927 RepID=UPI003F7DBE29